MGENIFVRSTTQQLTQLMVGLCLMLRSKDGSHFSSVMEIISNLLWGTLQSSLCCWFSLLFASIKSALVHTIRSTSRWCPGERWLIMLQVGGTSGLQIKPELILP